MAKFTTLAWSSQCGKPVILVDCEASGEKFWGHKIGISPMECSRHRWQVVEQFNRPWLSRVIGDPKDSQTGHSFLVTLEGFHHCSWAASFQKENGKRAPHRGRICKMLGVEWTPLQQRERKRENSVTTAQAGGQQNPIGQPQVSQAGLSPSVSARQPSRPRVAGDLPSTRPPLGAEHRMQTSPLLRGSESLPLSQGCCL